MSDFRDAVQLRELARRCFFAETEGELTLGSSATFAAGSVLRGFRAKQSNTPSVSHQKQAADTSDVTTSRIARNQRFRLSGRLGEGGYKGKVKNQIAVYLFSHPKKIGV